MIKDIHRPEVEDVFVAVVKELNELDESVWNVYLVNQKSVSIEGVLVSSKGYGEINGAEVKTSMLRHFLDVLPPKSFARIEPIMENVFGLFNEYWLSFYVDKVIYDKKFIFAPETIIESHLINIPLVEKKGVMIR
ncbi:MAG: hypothetical protein ACK4GL_04750 [Flavobacteriales bacterium]